MQAFVFPGQGSQYPGMGKELADNYPAAREVFDQADEALGFELRQLCFNGSSDKLALTENTQPAILTTSIAIYRELERRERLPDFVAGHSLGEYSALVAAGALDFRDAVRIVRQRGRFMQEAVGFGEGSMAVVLGMAAAEVEAICREVAGEDVVSTANVNSPNQTVIAGHRKAVDRAVKRVREGGAKRVLPLAVSAPFHCQLMKPAEARLAEEIRPVVFRDLRIPLVNNLKAEKVTRGEEARRGLIPQVSSAVLWNECVEELVRLGVSVFVEVGPGKVLTGLIRRIAPAAQAISIGSREELENYVRLF